MMKIFRESQKGSSLVTVMVLTGALLAGVAIYSHSHKLNQEAIAKADNQAARDRIFKTLETYVSNHNFIKHTAKKEHLGYGQGHITLYNCLNGEDEFGKGCQRKPKNDQRNQEGFYAYEKLTLIPPKDFEFPAAKTDKAPNSSQPKNCPSANDPSCYFSSPAPQGASVGFNFNGETSNLSPCFPLEPVIYVNPKCGKDLAGNDLTSCKYAEDMEFAVQLIHRSFPKQCPIKSQNSAKLGSYPKKLKFLSTARHTLVEFECNPGAFVKGYEGDGGLTCECRFPYSPIPGKFNEKGVLCQEIKDSCPGGSVMVSRDEKGFPVCKSLAQLSEENHQSMTFGNSPSLTGVSSSGMSCEQNGWMTDLQLECKGSVTTGAQEAEGHSCLFFYSFAKILNGEHFIPGPVPSRFYPSGTKPCNAYKEESFFFPPSNWYDVSCLGLMTGIFLAGGIGVKSLVKGAVKTVTSKVMSKVVAKAAAKGAAKAAKKAGANISKTTLKATTKAAEKAAMEASQQAALKAAKEGATVKAIKAAAQEAAEKAASKSAVSSIGTAAQKMGGTIMKKGVMQSIEKGAQEGGKTVLAKASKFLAKTVTSRASTKAANKLLVQNAKNTPKILFKKASKALHKAYKGTSIVVKQVGSKAVAVAPVANVIIDGFSPAVFAQVIALDVAMEAIAIAINILRNIVIFGIGPMLAVIFATVSGFLLSSWKVKVNYACYPIETEPDIQCTLSGTCQHYGEKFYQAAP